MRMSWIALTWCAVLVVSIIPAGASPITFNMEARITQISEGVPGAALLVSEAGIEVGTLITGSYTFDSLAPGSFGEYSVEQPFTLAMSGYGMASPVYNIKVFPTCPNPTCTEYQVAVLPQMNAQTTTDIPGFLAATWQLNLTDPSIQSFALPLVPPPIEGAVFAIALWKEPNQIQAVQLNARLESLTLSSLAVPEPGSISLLAGGLIAFAVHALRKRAI